MAQPSGARPRHSSPTPRRPQARRPSQRPATPANASYVPGEVPGDIGDLDTAPPASAASGLASGATMATTKISSRTAHTTRFAQAHAGARRGSRRRRESAHVPIIAVVIVAIVVLGAGGFFISRHLLSGSEEPTIEPGIDVKITIPDGAGGEEISSILKEAGVISDSSSFFREVRSQEAEMSLQSGTYEFVTGANVRDVVSQLASGPNSTADTITIPEGYSVAQIATVCADKLLIPYEDFMERAKASNYINDYPFLSEVEDDSLEGFLFPKTYDFGGREISADSVIRTMLSQYQTEVATIDYEAARADISSRYGIEMSDYEFVIMASIIEKEASLDDERADVASVFYNRLASWMPLQSDATVGYVIDHQVSAEDLEIDSVYNTYLYYGLTPTPICNPSFESLQAAAHPSDTNYFYFLLIDDGDYQKHVFSETYDEHLVAISEADADLA